MQKTILCFFILFISATATYAQETKHPVPQLLKEPATWEFEAFPLPPAFAPEIKYRGLEELRFAPGMFKKDTTGYFTYAFVARFDSMVDISQAEIRDYLLFYFKGLCATVARDKKMLIDTSLIAVTIAKKKNAPKKTTIYNARLNVLGVFADGAPVTLNMELKLVKDPVFKRLYLVIITSPLPKTDAIWKTLYQVQTDFVVPRQ